jgi:uncharacterized protein (TIGR03000 family)
MIRQALRFGVPALATAALLALPTLSKAQMMTVPGNMSGGRGGGFYGGNSWGGGWGGYNNNRGWSGYYNPGYYSSNPGYYNQGYYNQGYYSNYPSNNNNYSQQPSYGGYQSFYPSNPNANQSAYVRLRVPADAEVWFEGQKTQQTGTDRLYVSPPLDRNRNYVYDVKVRWTENGQQVERDRKLTVQGGTQADASFGNNAEEQPQGNSIQGSSPAPAPTTSPEPASQTLPSRNTGSESGSERAPKMPERR